MTMNAEQAAALEADEPNANDTAEVHGEGTPASGEQPTPELAPEGAGETSEAEGDKPEGEQPEAEKKPEQPSGWRQVEAAKKEQIKVAKARDQLNRDAERVKQYEAQLTQHFDQRTRDLDAREAQLKPLREALERKDLAALVALGFDFESYARENMTANTPEGIARRTQAEVEKLRKEREDERKRVEDQHREHARIAANQNDAHKLVHLVDTAPEECPELYAWTPERIADEGLGIRDALARQHRRMPSYDQVLAELQKRARNEAAVSQKRTSVLQQKRGTSSSDAGSAGKADPNRTSAGGNPPALSSRTANERPPTPPREKTEAEIDAECLAELRGLRR